MLIIMYLGCELLLSGGFMLVESFSQFLSSDVDINITVLHLAVSTMFSVLQFLPSSFLISFSVCIFLGVSLLIRWCIFLHKEHGVAIFSFFCSLASLIGFFLFSTGGWYFYWRILDKCFTTGCQVITIVVFSFCFCFVLILW